MKQRILSVLVLFLSFFFGINQDALNSIVNTIDPPKAGYARVLEVADGDTITVNFMGSKERIRFIGVDTPETHHPDKAVQCFGLAASAFTKSLLTGQDVKLLADPTNSNRDRYDRLLRYVYLEDGTLVNQKIIEEGYGFAYTIFPFEKKADFVRAQSVAKENNTGLWNSCDIEQDGDYINTAPAEGA